MSAALESGSTISHYRVKASLGAGGMGEVYEAQDESLDRAVALKILPPDLVKHEDRVQRFIQEAKSASSLSHPHIVTIYEIGEAEVAAKGDSDTPSSAIHFIAMELISGDTFKHKIHQEQTELKTLLGYMAQVAEGLAKAHTAGIIHRDLKPENIMVSDDGYAKVLDFGLAKLTEREQSQDALSHGLTAVQDITREGAVVGTVGYMAPEQVQGKPVDHRADVFSFGCILYEAATRKKPFGADSDVEAMHRILRDTPVPIDEINPEVPSVLRRVIRRCLAKNPEKRFQSMKDLAIELREIVEEYDTLAATASDSNVSASSISGTFAAPSQKRVSVWIAVGVLVATLAAIGFWQLNRQGPVETTSTFQNMRMTQLTSSGNVFSSALSPDGKYLALILRDGGKYTIWMRQVLTGSDVQISEPMVTPFLGLRFSIDGNYVYFVNQETSGPGYSTLYQVPVLGGTPRNILFDIDSAPTFSPDGSLLAFIRGYPQDEESSLMIANADGSGERKLATIKNPEAFDLEDPAWSPDGTRIVAIVNAVEGGFHKRLAMVEVTDGKITLFGPKTWSGIDGPAWAPDGKSLVFTAHQSRGGVTRQIWRLSYPDGEASRITNDLNEYNGVSMNSDGLSLSTNQVSRTSNVWRTSIKEKGKLEQITFGSGIQEATGNVQSLPQGEILYTAAQGSWYHIFKISGDGSNKVRLTNGDNFNFDTKVSDDGKTIAYTSIGEDRTSHVWTMNPDGSDAKQVTTGAGEFLRDLSPDGTWILYVKIGLRDLWKTPISGGEGERVLSDLLGAAAISPNGARIAADRYVPGEDRLVRTVFVIDALDGSEIWSSPFPNGFNLRWHPDGESLTFSAALSGGATNVWRMRMDESAPTQLTQFTSGELFGYAWLPDGENLYLDKGSTKNDVVLLEGF